MPKKKKKNNRQDIEEWTDSFLCFLFSVLFFKTNERYEVFFRPCVIFESVSGFQWIQTNIKRNPVKRSSAVTGCCRQSESAGLWYLTLSCLFGTWNAPRMSCRESRFSPTSPRAWGRRFRRHRVSWISEFCGDAAGLLLRSWPPWTSWSSVKLFPSGAKFYF